MDCPEAIFKKLLDGIHDDEVDEFVIEGLGHMGYMSLIKANFPEMTPELMESWNVLQGWEEDAGVSVIPDDVDILEEDGKKPSDFFADFDSIKTAALSYLRDSVPNSIVGIVEIESAGRALSLIYTEMDFWTHGSGDLLVVRDLDELTEEKGFYEWPAT
jgi:hypothetical protein